MAQDPVPEPHGLKPSGVIVEAAPKLDLESYISNYDGSTRLDRLVLIGTSSKTLASDALQAALAEAKASKNVSRYLDIVAYLQQEPGNQQNGMSNAAAAAVVEDTAWVEATTKVTERETVRLESELKGYKNNLIKESIRMGNEELGAHYHSISDLPSASRAYTRMRDYCTTPKQLADRDLKLALLSISQHNFIALQSHTLRAQSHTLPAADAAKLSPCVPPLLGLASLAGADYRGAARYFLATEPAFISGLEPVAGGVLVNRAVLTANDVASYGALCALATYSRSDLRASLLDSPTFRQFLELEPHLRRAVSAFVGAKYTVVLEALAAYRADYELDLYLQRHVDTLWNMVRKKSILSFFGPFERVSISTLVSTFGPAQSTPSGGPSPEEAMIAELATMIEEGALSARLDLVSNVLIAKTGDGVSERRAVHEKALRMAREQEAGMGVKLMRLQMMECGFEVNAKTSKEDWVDDGDEDAGGSNYGQGRNSRNSRGGRGGGGGGGGGDGFGAGPGAFFGGPGAQRAGGIKGKGGSR